MEADFVAQTSTPMNREEKRAWFREHLAQARKQGCTWQRMSYHPENPDMLKVECWLVEPANPPEPFGRVVVHDPETA